MPRKTHDWQEDDDSPRGASMRPRPDAAENLDRLPCARRRVAASMRPRPDAAENGACGGRRT